jgi:hypothetical protein
MTKYRYARGSDQSIVDVLGMESEQRHECAPYVCFGCGGELIPNLGKKKVKHFAHKPAGTCSRETYLHELAKDAFFRTYSRCLTEQTPYVFKTGFPATCHHYQSEFGETCSITKVIDVSLTRLCKNIAVEQPYQGFIPDILLSTEDGSEVLFFEMAVTHSSDENKIRSGHRIIEIAVQDERDVERILSGTLSESDHAITTFNFNKKSLDGDVCHGECQRKIHVFVLYESQKSILLEVSPREALNPNLRGKIIYREVIGFSTGDKGSQIDRYKSKVREAHFSGRPIKNCYLCRYHGADGLENAVFCKFRKESVSSNDAVACEYYRVFRSLDECHAADRANEDYAKKHQPRMLANAFMRRISRNLP